MCDGTCCILGIFLTWYCTIIFVCQSEILRWLPQQQNFDIHVRQYCEIGVLGFPLPVIFDKWIRSWESCFPNISCQWASKFQLLDWTIYFKWFKNCVFWIINLYKWSIKVLFKIMLSKDTIVTSFRGNIKVLFKIMLSKDTIVTSFWGNIKVSKKKIKMLLFSMSTTSNWILVNNMLRQLVTLKLFTQYWDNCDPDLKLVFYQHALLTAFILLQVQGI
jgi:hypothetical protein